MKSYIMTALIIFGCTQSFAGRGGDGGKEGGGGSYHRLMRHAGFVSVVSNYKRGSIWSSKVRDLFLENAIRFIDSLEAKLKKESPLKYEDATGATATLELSDIPRMRGLWKSLKDRKEEAIEVVDHLESMSTFEEITGVNLPKQGKVILSERAFSEIEGMEPDLKSHILLSFSGHEILSLLSIENVENYAVSSSVFYFHVFNEKHFVCFDQGSVERKIEMIQVERQLSLEAKNFNWPVALGDKSKIRLSIEETDFTGRGLVAVLETESDLPNVRFGIGDFVSKSFAMSLRVDDKVLGDENFKHTTETQFWCQRR